MNMNTSDQIKIKTINKKKYWKKANNYCVTDLELLYKLADFGLLEDLRGVNKDKSDPQVKRYYFEKTDDVMDVVNKFYECK